MRAILIPKLYRKTGYIHGSSLVIREDYMRMGSVSGMIMRLTMIP